MATTISKATAFLEEAFNVLNRHYFNGELPKAIITIQSSPRAYGHFTTYDAWKNKDKGFKEINIGAESLDRPLANTIATLIHEMVHLYCFVNDIKDTSRGNTYHNKRFKAEAEQRGLIIEYDKKIGHCITQPSKELRSFIAKQKWRNKLNIHRSGGVGADEPKGRTRTPSHTRKYVCGKCGNSVRATKDVNIACLDCREQMIVSI